MTHRRRRGRSTGRASRRSRPNRSRSGSAARRAAPIDRAARLGDAFLIGPEATPAEVRDARRAPTARRAHATAGRRRRSRCAATCTSARDDADAPTGRGPDRRPRATAASTRRRRSSADVDRVAEAFADLGAAGCTDVIVRHLADDQDEVLASFERLGAVRAAVALSHAARTRDRRP